MCQVKELQCIAETMEVQIAHYQNHIKACKLVPNVWRLWVRKYDLRKLRLAINTNSYYYLVPDSKTLQSLWRLHGLERSQYDSDEKLSLLQSWVTILYGNNVAESLNVEAKLLEIHSGQSRANHPYYKGEENAIRIMFVPAIESLIEKLSAELPEYE